MPQIQYTHNTRVCVERREFLADLTWYRFLLAIALVGGLALIGLLLFASYSCGAAYGGGKRTGAVGVVAPAQPTATTQIAATPSLEGVAKAVDKAADALVKIAERPQVAPQVTLQVPPMTSATPTVRKICDERVLSQEEFQRCKLWNYGQ
jgi:hypothetical protein